MTSQKEGHDFDHAIVSDDSLSDCSSDITEPELVAIANSVAGLDEKDFMEPLDYRTGCSDQIIAAPEYWRMVHKVLLDESCTPTYESEHPSKRRRLS
eukprot:CAMPEP_0183308032 /NCGR_PEP_ID=MMETSP0160_2-20130417/19706_1 /TAXON_ID=2839 ORGANISM="Odontella Sinensis, Strain Grunow 1884" /NCGR_SAMPLE_ID=MMETSP0160_2 /ASSEMBLY_ACC=CAM_ASM_000250 /LENGTH=96 /DNA_ID=CAMNT_0025471775 /DNA_START=211 /DNA_END=501 /DNA_ORIENTATION=-